MQVNMAYTVFGCMHDLPDYSVRTQDQYKSLGEHVQAVKLEHMKSQLALLKSSLEQFAIKHRWDITLMHAAVRCK
jgi:EAP30/Vps36 family